MEIKKFKYIFSTERLGFRNWDTTDLNKYVKMSSDPDVMKFFPKQFWLDKDSASASIKASQSHYKEFGFTFFVVEEIESQDFMGFIGLKNITYDIFFSPAVEIGWRLDKKFWGKGYATEGAKKCLDWFFSNFPNSKVVSITPVSNIPSENVMKKIGMKKITVFDHPLVDSNSPLLSHVLYEINK